MRLVVLTVAALAAVALADPLDDYAADAMTRLRAAARAGAGPDAMARYQAQADRAQELLAERVAAAAKAAPAVAAPRDPLRDFVSDALTRAKAAAMDPRASRDLVAQTEARASEALRMLVRPANLSANMALVNAFDSTARALRTDYNCLRSTGFRIAALRIYNGDQGRDGVGFDNIETARAAGFNIELLVNPSTSGRKSASTQYREVTQALQRAGYKANRLWLQVTSPFKWTVRSGFTNANFIRDFISEGARNKVDVGVYTNWYDWSEITENSRSVRPTHLWYWQVNGPSQRGRSPNNFNDFIDFGNLPYPLVKQYGIGERICNVDLNVSVGEGPSSADDFECFHRRCGEPGTDKFANDFECFHRRCGEPGTGKVAAFGESGLEKIEQ